MEVEPYISGRAFEKKPDWEYYARRVAQTLAYVTEVYGWDEKALFTGTQPAKQKDLFSEDFEGSPEDPRGPARTEKKLTLEDFF
jgi:DNA polymerase I